jgi:4-hydroxy-3-polyprenylbenzoate decarboxylase
VHLKNLLALDQAGALILPASPGFYQQPETIEDLVDFVVARILDQLDIPQDLVDPYSG